LSSANDIGIVILAAGTSSRFGEPKQLLQYDDKNLLQHTIDAAVNSNAKIVIVVLGANAELISKEIDKTKVQVVGNNEWQEGMASSVRTGLSTLQKVSPSTGAVIFMVCDQPFVSSSLINNLINTHFDTGKPIVTCNYGEAVGPPALFHKNLFDELMELKGDVGARKIIQQHSDQIATILFTEGKIDIDTKEDYEELNNS
jgi:molybdenum cofactor cytidylyltransferase